MVISILTLFPQMFAGPLDSSIIKRAQNQQLVKINYVNLRDFATDKYKTVDDRPYGGGLGMLMRVDVVDRALEFTLKQYSQLPPHVVLLDPKGKLFTQAKARQLALRKHLILICGHYEGVDARVDQLVQEKISIGRYILTGGEIPALVIVDSVVRLLTGVLKEGVTVNESFSQSKPEYLQYTRPEVYKGLPVPKILLSGHHQKIADWRKSSRSK